MTERRIDELRDLQPEEREIAERIARAGSREEPPREDVEAALSAARFAWERRLRDREASTPAASHEHTEIASFEARSSRRRLLAVVATIAAATLLTVGVWLRRPDTPTPAALVASVERSVGRLEIHGEDGWTALASGTQVSAGAEMRTGPDGRAALITTDGATLRFDRASRWSIASSSRIELESGAVYADTGNADGLTVATAIGAARDIGTRFAVRVENETMRVGVRDGAVEVDRGDDTFRADHGVELVVQPEGTPVRAAISAFSDVWSWTHEVAPAFELEGATLAAFLGWLATETGWTVRYDEESVGEPAERIVLHGSLDGVSPRDAPEVVLPGVGVTYRIEDGVLSIE